jgi:tRNA pseudouridine13 synthase
VTDSGWELPDWRRQLPRPEVTARLRAVPEDFQVWELPLVEPQGTGSHLWLEVRKRGANTRWVAERLAAAAGAPLRDVGFAGMKDRHAVTTQWFSLGLQQAQNDHWRDWDIPDVSILQAQRHGRKLQRGALRGNRFRLLLRDLEGPTAPLEDRLEAIRRTGVPNYFGPQRFGRAGANIPRAAHWLESGGRIGRSQRSIYLSVVRSYLFNRLLAQRVELGNWNRLLDGDLALLDGSRSTFPCSLPDPDLERRCTGFDIHPTGPLPGREGKRGNSRPAGEAAALEEEVLRRFEPLVQGLQRAGVEAGRRSLRVAPAELDWQWEGACLALEFSLPPGAYATSVLRELVLTDPDTISEDT